MITKKPGTIRANMRWADRVVVDFIFKKLLNNIFVMFILFVITILK